MPKSVFPADRDDERFCPDCNGFRSLGEFYAGSRPGKLQRYCITHFNERKQQRYEANRERYNAKTILWQSEHPESVITSRRRYKAKPEVKAREREREQQPHIKAKRHEYDASHRAENNDYNRDWKKRNKDKVRVYNNNRRAKMLANGGEHTDQEWRAVMARYGWHCICCGALAPLCFDHIRPVDPPFFGPSSIDNCQPLCKPCNSSKNKTEYDFRDKPGHGLLYDTRPDLPIGTVDLAMGDLPVPEHAQFPGRIDLLGRTEKWCTYHKCIQPLEDFRPKGKRGWFYPSCRDAENLKQREKRAATNPDYKPRTRRVGQSVVAPAPKNVDEKLCSGPTHDLPTSLPIASFPTRRAASGSIVPKSYCYDCLRELQRIDRETKRFAKPLRTEPWVNPLKGRQVVVPEDQRETKICAVCGQSKPVSEFNYRDKAEGKLQPMCRDCQKAENMANYDPHPRTKTEPASKYVPLGERSEGVCRGPLHPDGIVLPIEAFPPRKPTKDGTPRRDSYCCDCKREQLRIWRQSKKEAA